MLQLKNVTRRYNDKVAVSGVDLEIEPGSFVGIIGRSGSGKSTLLRMINRLVEPSEGTIHWDGRDVTGLKGSGLRDWRAQCAMIFRHFNLVDRLDVLTNVLMGRLNYVSTPKSLLRIWSDEERLIALSALQQFDIAHLAAHRADELSGGQQQRVAIARALVQQPRIILADEPIASLDPRNTRSVMDALRRINREYGITVLCNLHSLDIARSYCDRLVGRSAGKIVFRGTPSMLTDMASRDLYGMEADDVIDTDEQAETMPMPVPQSAEAVLRQLSA